MPLTTPLQQVDRTCVRHRGRKLIYFGGCDYFRLSSHPRVLRALAQGASQFGLNVAASRTTTGNHVLFGQLERAIATFFGADSAVLAASGYATNLIVAQALAGTVHHALIDERSHGSVFDAAVFLGCRVEKFRHRDPAQAGVLARRVRGKVVLLTDGLFAQDGSVAPLREYLRTLPRNALLVVDDAHGAGVVGKSGRGTPEQEGIASARLIQTVSLSKAFGVYGGAVLCSEEFRDAIIERSRLFNGNTPLPLPLAAAALVALEILHRDRALRRRLMANADFVKERLRQGGIDIPEYPGPIVRLVPHDRHEAKALRRRLLRHGVFPTLIHYPGGPSDGYFRFMISSEHMREQLDALAGALA